MKTLMVCLFQQPTISHSHYNNCTVLPYWSRNMKYNAHLLSSCIRFVKKQIYLMVKITEHIVKWHYVFLPSSVTSYIRKCHARILLQFPLPHLLPSGITFAEQQIYKSKITERISKWQSVGGGGAISVIISDKLYKKISHSDTTAISFMHMQGQFYIWQITSPTENSTVTHQFFIHS